RFNAGVPGLIAVQDSDSKFWVARLWSLRQNRVFYRKTNAPFRAKGLAIPIAQRRRFAKALGPEHKLVQKACRAVSLFGSFPDIEWNALAVEVMNSLHHRMSGPSGLQSPCRWAATQPCGEAP